MRIASSNCRAAVAATRPAVAAEFLLGFMWGGALAPITAGAIIGLYLAKSALGINLFPGPSFLHESYFFLVR